MGELPDGPSWSEIAAWYDELLDRGSGPHETAAACLLRLLPNLTGAHLLDLACGQGMASRALADAGARMVVGVDTAAPMLDLARKRTDPSRPIRYVIEDAQHLASFAASTFDGVSCQLALMDIPDLDATFRSVRRVLKPGGWFAFVILHPCYSTPEAGTQRGAGGKIGMWVTGYFNERFWRSTNPGSVRRAGNYHRTLMTYLNALAGAGLSLELVEEPRPTALYARQQPVSEQVPIFLGGRARRYSSAPDA